MRLLSVRRASLVMAGTLVLSSLVTPAFAGLDDDARFKSDGVTRNSIDPIQTGGIFADYPTNVEPTTGLRISPATSTQLIQGQRFDLRVETQIPGTSAPVLKSLTVNGTNITTKFNAKLTSQGLGLESGTPSSANLYGATVRNLSFERAGVYTVTAIVNVDGVDRTITNTYPVASYAFKGNVKHVVFFLGDAMGLPVRTAARIYGKGIFEGRAKGRLNMDKMEDYGLVSTSSFDSVITDSAPGMANYVTGLKQPNNALNVSPDNTPESSFDNPRIETLWEYMKRTQGWKTGVVSDAFITDATPAAEAGHTRARSDRTAIAQQFLDYYKDGTAQPATGFSGLQQLTQPLDVILGGGARDWLPIGNSTLINFYQASSSQGRTDSLNLFTTAQSLGYTVVQDATSLAAAPSNKPILGIFVGDFRPGNALGADNIPGVLDRLVANGKATIGGKDAAGVGQTAAPPAGAASTCGSTVQACFQTVPSKTDLVSKAISVLNGLNPDGWILLVEQSQTDKLAHPLEYERVVYEALELDNALGSVLHGQAQDGQTLTVVSADHAQPETIVGVALPGAITGGQTPVGGCFTNGLASDASSGSLTLTINGTGATTKPCPLQDVIGTFNDATFPTYTDANGDGFPDDPDASIKLVIDDGGRPTYSQDYLTNLLPLNPSGTTAAIPNPSRDPNGILLTGNMPVSTVFGSANKTEGNVGVAPHSGDDVPLSASGPGADLFAGTYENTDVHVRIATVLSGKQNRRSLDRGTDYTGVPNLTPPGLSLKGF